MHSTPSLPQNPRRRTARALTFILALITLVPVAASARTTVSSSVEWLVCQSQVVVVGKLAEIKSEKGPGDITYHDCILTVTESIKGDAKALSQLTFCDRGYVATDVKWKTPGEELLVFLRPWPHQGNSEPRMNGLLVPVVGAPLGIIRLADLPADLYDRTFAKVTDRDTLLRLCRTWATSPVKHSVRELTLFAIPQYLLVPVEEKHRVQFLALAKSEKQYDRRKAAQELFKFPGPESEAALRELLQDSTVSEWKTCNDTISKLEYAVRSAARDSLQLLGLPVPNDLPLERAPTAEERQKCRHDAWRSSFNEALKDGWKLAALRDGPMREVEGIPWVVVEADLANGPQKATLVVVPSQVENEANPSGLFLGEYGQNTGCLRRLYASKNMPEALQQRLTQYFGLERPAKK